MDFNYIKLIILMGHDLSVISFLFIILWKKRSLFVNIVIKHLILFRQELDITLVVK